MKTVAIIPSGYESSRFPGKPLALIAGKPMIQHVYERTVSVNKIDEVYVATDDRRIFDTVTSIGGKALMTSDKHTCGTDRLAECAEILEISDDDLILNIQGDEPLIRKEMIEDLISCFDDPSVLMGTLKKEITEEKELDNPNVVKVITDVNGNAIYFSRFRIPYRRGDFKAKYFKHIGVYGYRKHFLMAFSSMEKTQLEKSESLEQLRVLENGYRIKVKETEYQTVGVDTPEQLKEVERLISERQ